MKLEDLDVVYMVKDAIYNEELRYSLRSVGMNFPHNRLWFVGGKPMYVSPDKQVIVNQKGKTKWDKVRSMLKMVAENGNITEDFVLFNDDFFIMKPVASLPPFTYGTLADLCKRVERRNNNRPTRYTMKLKETARILEEEGLPAMNFELHVPIILNRKKLLSIIEKYPDVKGTRSLYGNTYLTETSKQMKDVKIFDNHTIPDADSVFLSTEDVSFARGNAGVCIRQQFPFKSRWEK